MTDDVERIFAARPDRDAQAVLLLRTYELDRHDDVQLLTALHAQLAASFALLSVVAYILATPHGRPYWMIILVPVLPLPAVAFGATHVVESVVRGIVLDAEEAHLRRVGLALTVPYLAAHTKIDGDAPPLLRVPSSHSLRNNLWRGRLGAIALGVTGISFLGAYATLLAYSFGHEHARHLALALIVLISCGVALLLLLYVAFVGIWPSCWMKRELKQLAAAQDALEKPPPEASGAVEDPASLD